jgi:hypothetical protein
MALGLEYAANGKAELRDAAAADNKALPIHRWVPWIAGFSGTFARDAIEAYLPARGRRQHLVLDPFAGVGTTLVEALKLGCHAIGFEVNKFAALAAQAKVNCIDVEPERLQLLGDAAERLGLTVEDIRLVRTKRVGNSIIDSAVRNGHDAGHKHKTQLYDAAVILRN